MNTFDAAEPQLYVKDIAASCKFYSRILGFSVGFTNGEPPFYSQVFRDGARLNLRQVDHPVVDGIMISPTVRRIGGIQPPSSIGNGAQA